MKNPFSQHDTLAFSIILPRNKLAKVSTRPGSAVAAVSKPRGLPIKHNHGQRKEEVVHPNEILKGAEDQIEDVDHAHRRSHECQGDQETKDANAAVVGRNVSTNLTAECAYEH